MAISESTFATVLLAASLLSVLALGAIVFFRDPSRPTHRLFALLTLNLALWTAGVLAIVHRHDVDSARLAIMATFAVAAFLPATFYHFIGFFPSSRFSGSFAALGVLYSGALLLVMLTPTELYLAEVLVFPDRPPLAEYGPAFNLYGILVAISMVASFTNLVRKRRVASGIERRQLEHVIAGIFITTVFASITNVLAPVLNIGYFELYGPCFLLIFVALIAYSMVRYHLLDILVIVSRTTVYGIMTAVVVAIFAASVWVVHWVFSGDELRNTVTTLLAAMLVVLVLEPLKERLQHAIDRIVLLRHYDAKALIERIGRAAVSTVQLDLLLEHVCRDIERTVGVPLVRVLLRDEENPAIFKAMYCSQGEKQSAVAAVPEALQEHASRHAGPLCLQALRHGRPGTLERRLILALESIGAHVFVPLVTSQGMVGGLLLGEKTTRDIFSHEDMHVFSTIAPPLTASIENARLYARLEAMNAHMERIMHNMRGAVVAIDRMGTITTVNPEARELFGDLPAGSTLADLQAPVATLLAKTLSEQRGITDIETTIHGADGEPMPVAMSSSYFEGGAKDKLGAMVLLYNLATIKRLEANVQRADRLTSIGTLAAGMAHEIKNPLQSIKTFTQLLLSRFDDSDFRKTFSEVVPPEVQRIDGIVSRLLDFARPKPVHFAPQDLRRTVDAVLALVENQLRKHGILVTMEFPEESKRVMGDDQQLHQVFLNLILNAIDAMKDSPERQINIRLYYARTHLARPGFAPLADIPCARVVISDTGCGIPEQHISQLFNPFFTTKAHGSGLGLSVVHGILTDHSAQIDVSSTVDAGTSFTISFPLTEREEAVERVRI